MFTSTEIINSWKTSVCEVKRTSSFQFIQGFLCCLCSLWEIEKAFVAAVCSLPFPFRSTPPHDISLTLLKQPNQVAKHSPFTSLGVWTCNTTAKVRQLLGFSTDVLFSGFLQMYRSVCIWGSVTLQLSAAMNLLLTWSMVLLVQASWSHQWIFIWEFFLCTEKNYLPGDSCIFLFQCVPFYLLILWARAV